MSENGFDLGFRFGRYELREDYRALRVGRHEVDLTPTDLSLLKALVAAHGKVVSFAQLIRAAARTAPGCNEGNINVYVNRVMNKLDENTIVNVRARGYQLGCQVEAVGSEDEWRVLHLTALHSRAERERQNMRDEEWDAKYVPTVADVRTGLDWSLANPGRKHLAIALAGASGRIWGRSSQVAVGRDYISRAIALLDDSVRPAHAALLLKRAGEIWREADRLYALDMLQQALIFYRKLDDRPNLGDTLGLIGGVYAQIGENDTAKVHLEEARDILWPSGRSKALWNVFNGLGNYHLSVKQFKQAAEFYEQARDIARLLHDSFREHLVILNWAEMEFLQGAVDRAIERAKLAARGLKDAPVSYRVRPLVNLATYLLVRGDLILGRYYAETSIAVAATEGGYWLRLCLLGWSLIMASDGHYSDSARLLGFIHAEYLLRGEARQEPEELLLRLTRKELLNHLTADSMAIWFDEGTRFSEAEAIEAINYAMTAPD